MAIFEALSDNSSQQRTYNLISPVSLESIGELNCATTQEVSDAVAKARAAQPAWGGLSIAERIRYLVKLRDEVLKAQDEIMEVAIRETGKVQQDAQTFEVFAVCEFITYWCKQAKKTLKDEKIRPSGLLGLMKKVHITYKPMGVVAVIAPWNGPFVLTANPCIQAMLAGNTVVAKGSEATPECAKLLETLCARAGFPDGVCQVLMGDGQTGADLVNAKVDKVSFTGSVNTGKKIAVVCSERLIPFTLELGGKDAMIVCDDAPLEQAVHAAVWGGCVNTGHFCCGVERIYVEEGIYDDFVQGVTKLTQSLRQGQSHGVEEDVGAVFWDRQLSIIESHVEDAKAKGAKILAGGQRNPNEKGLYYEATVMVDVPDDCDVMTLETFGPVLPIVKVKNVEEGIAKANDSNYGLHGSVWTKDKKKGLAIAKRIETGAMAVNDIHMMYGVACAPFGGVKESGMGSINGRNGLRGYTHAMPIVVGRYSGLDGGYPHEEKQLEQMTWIMNFMWKNPIGRFLFGP